LGKTLTAGFRAGCIWFANGSQYFFQFSLSIVVSQRFFLWRDPAGTGLMATQSCELDLERGAASAVNEL
jgi:hypothetical protein